MKKSIVIFVIAALVLLSSGLWLMYAPFDFHPLELLHIGVIIITVGFALLIGFKRLSSARRGEPAEDELSRKVLQKASAISYFISLYLWVFLLWLKDRVPFEVEELLGTGILGMALIFVLAWAVVHLKGLAHD